MSTESARSSDAQQRLIQSVFDDQPLELEVSLQHGVDINKFDPETGLAPLHIAIGMNNLRLVKILLEHQAAVVPDRRGRWPSTIAGLCEVDGELCDLISDEEMKLGNV